MSTYKDVTKRSWFLSLNFFKFLIFIYFWFYFEHVRPTVYGMSPNTFLHFSILSLIYWLDSMVGLCPDIFQNWCSRPDCTGVQDKPESGGVGSPSIAKLTQVDVINSLTNESLTSRGPMGISSLSPAEMIILILFWKDPFKTITKTWNWIPNIYEIICMANSLGRIHSIKLRPWKFASIS